MATLFRIILIICFFKNILNVPLIPTASNYQNSINDDEQQQKSSMHIHSENDIHEELRVVFISAGTTDGNNKSEESDKIFNHVQQKSSQQDLSLAYGIQYDLAFNPNIKSEELFQYQASLMKNNMDLMADPCDDFYQYACGNWEKLFPIPADRSETNVFSLLSMNIYKAIQKLLSSETSVTTNSSLSYETADNDASDDNSIDENLVTNNYNTNDRNVKIDAEEKAKIFYQSCINKSLLNKRGTEPLRNFIQNYGGWPVLDGPNWNENAFDWVNVTAYAALLGHSIILDAVIETDLKNSHAHTIYITEPELGLSNRDDYLSQANTKHLEAYTILIQNTIKLLGVDVTESEKVSKEIVDFEKKLANISYDYRERPALIDLYKETTIEEIEKFNPYIDWRKYLEIMLGVRLNNTQRIVKFNSKYYRNIEALILETEKRTVANYIQWRNVQNFIENLDENFDKIIKDFNEALTGQKTLQSRSVECIRETNDHLGMAVGAMFVRQYFDEESKNDVFKITKEMQHIFRDLLKDIDWLDANTKQLAEEKVNKTTLAVGYPDFILSKSKLNEYYENLHFNKNEYFENSVALRYYKVKKSHGRLYKDVDKNEWPMHPVVVNAFFEQTKNRIVIPAGILQPPIYHQQFPRFLNYGAIGAVVGHELTHGFDDIGRNFDLNGNMKEWWTNNSIAAFHERATCFIHQYNNFSMHGKFIHGTASKGENIADNGGIRQSYYAYKKWLKDNKDSDIVANEKLPGLDLNGPQLFFLSFAQAWCGAIRPEAIENRLETDFHCPGRFRVLGTLANFEAFADEYKCPVGSRMNPRHRCKIW